MDKMSLLTDLAVGGIIALSIFFSYYRGLVREVFSLAAWIASALVAVDFFPQVQGFVRQFISVDIIADLVAGGVLFVLALIIFSIFAHFIADTVQKSALKRIDRPLGVLFGFVRGAFIVFIAYVALLWAVPSQKFPAWISDARTYPYVKKVSFATLELVSSTFKGTEFADAINQLMKPRNEEVMPSAVEEEIPDDENTSAPVADADTTTGASGYDSDSREDLDQLIEQNQ